MASIASVPSAETSATSRQNILLPIYDAFLDLPHPAASTIVNERRKIIAPPQGEAFTRSKDVGVELATEEGLARVASFCFPEFRQDIHGMFNALPLLPAGEKIRFTIPSWGSKCTDFESNNFIFPVSFTNLFSSRASKKK